MHPKNSFVTLTYNTQSLPPDGSLNVKHWQDFAKRLRKKIGPFRFFHCGEYGDKNGRPHYHACIFGEDFSADRIHLKGTGDHRLYTSKLLEETWQKGFCTAGQLTYESSAYVARYVLKKITGPMALKAYSRISADGTEYQLKPEYITMSRRPGIGKTWLNKYASDVYPADEVIHKARRFRPPRFYDKQLPEKQLEQLQQKRQQKVKLRGKDLTPERLIVREKVLEETTKTLIRNV